MGHVMYLSINPDHDSLMTRSYIWRHSETKRAQIDVEIKRIRMSFVTSLSILSAVRL